MDTYDQIPQSRLRRLPPGDVYDERCPSRSVIDLLANKWTLMVIWSLADGPMRFGELRRRITGVTQKMLTQSLRELERNGLATRTVYATTPPSVEYALTPLGQSITSVTEQMCQWAEVNMGKVLMSRRDYDVAVAPAVAAAVATTPTAKRTVVRAGRRQAP